MEYKSFPSAVKSVSDDDLVLEHFIQTEHRDFGQDVMRARGMELIGGKPTVLFDHGFSPLLGRLPIAKPLSFKPGENQGEEGIIAKTKFFPNEWGKMFYQMNKEGYATQWSVGYTVLKSNPLYGGGREIISWICHEYSIVAVAMNPYARTLEKRFGDIKFKFESDHKSPCDCGQSLCLKSADGRSFQCRYRPPMKITIPDSIITDLARQCVRNEISKIKGMAD